MPMWATIYTKTAIFVHFIDQMGNETHEIGLFCTSRCPAVAAAAKNCVSLRKIWRNDSGKHHLRGPEEPFQQY